MSVRDIVLASSSSTTTTGDPNWANVSLLLSGETTDVDANWSSVSFMMSGNDLLDYSNNHNTVTVNGSMSVNTTTKKYGNGSVFHAAGSTNYLSVPGDCINFGTGDFTIEFWGYTTNVGAESLGMAGNVAGSSFMLMCGGNGSGRISLGVTSTSWDFNSAVSAIVANTWYHIAYSRNSGFGNLYINGTSVANGNTTTNYINATAFEIGRRETSYGATYDCYYSDIRITKGVGRYPANFTPPTASLPTFAIIDKSVNNFSITPYGNAQLTTSVKKYGSSSIYFDGSTDRLSVASSTSFAFGTGDFTIECWVNPTTAQTSDMFWVSAAGTGGLFFGTHSGGIGWGRANLAWDYTSGAYLTLNVWSHVVLVRSGTAMGIYVNGTVAGALQINGTSYDASTTALNIGSQGASYYFTGYLDDVRITKGVARYTSPFTPPTAAFLTDSGTVTPTTPTTPTTPPTSGSTVSLLLSGDGTNGSSTFTDLSTTPNTMSAFGNAQINTTQKKFGTGSMLFDGAGDYLTMPTTANLIFDADFTIECWAYRVSASANYDALYTTNALQNWDTNGNATALVWSCGGFHGFGNPWTPYSSGTSVPTGSWVHMAVTKASGTVRFFIGGTQVHTLTHSGNIGYSGQTQGIAIFDSYSGPGGRLFFNGYIDDFCITKGIAKYTANYTPPTTALPTS